MHDDVIDGDRERRHRPTVWAAFGVGHAITAGDALAHAGHAGPARRGHAGGRARGRRLLADATGRLIAGADRRHRLRDARRRHVDECVEMADAKTGALLGCAAALGAVLAGAAGARGGRAAATTALQLGLAFQAVDDMLGIWGEPAVTGKPVLAATCASGRRRCPVTAALARADGHRARACAGLLAGQPRRRGRRRPRRPSSSSSCGGRDGPTEAGAGPHFDAALAGLERRRRRAGGRQAELRAAAPGSCVGRDR